MTQIMTTTTMIMMMKTLFKEMRKLLIKKRVAIQVVQIDVLTKKMLKKIGPFLKIGKMKN